MMRQTAHPAEKTACTGISGDFKDEASSDVHRWLISDTDFFPKLSEQKVGVLRNALCASDRFRARTQTRKPVSGWPTIDSRPGELKTMRDRVEFRELVGILVRSVREADARRNVEIENLKREVADLLQRVDALTTGSLDARQPPFDIVTWQTPEDSLLAANREKWVSAYPDEYLLVDARTAEVVSHSADHMVVVRYLAAMQPEARKYFEEYHTAVI